MKISVKWLALIALPLFAAGCANAPQSGFCDEARPICLAHPDVADMLAEEDPELVLQLLSHNEHGAKVCRDWSCSARPLD